MIGSFCRASQRRAVLFSLAVICIVLAGCSQTFRQIAIPLPIQTGDPAPLDHALFAATGGTSKPGSVTFVDVPGDTNVGQIAVGNNPVHIGLTFGGGRAITSNTGDNTITSFQTGITTPSTNVTTLPAGANPVFSHSRQNGKLYVALSGLSQLGVVDASLALTGPPVGLGTCSNPVAISQVPNGGNVYVACNGSANVAEVTSSDNVFVKNIAVGASPVWIDTSSDGKYTFVANQGGNSVSVICSTIDISVCTGDTVISTPGVGGAPAFLRYDAHSQHVYVAGAGFVSIIDASGITPSFSVLKTLTGTERLAAGGGCACAFGQTWVTALLDGSRFYVSDQTGKSVSVYSAANFAFIKTISLATTAEPGTTPIMIDSDKNSTKVYTANTGSNDFTIIKTFDNTEVLPQIISGIPARLTPPMLPGCTTPPTPADACRQTPTWVVVLP